MDGMDGTGGTRSTGATGGTGRTGRTVDPTVRQPCAGAIVHDGRRRLLLIRRGTPPSQGLWSVPGGRCRPGEPSQEACVREAREETGLDVEVVRPAGTVERTRPAGGVYVIDDYVCRVLGGTLRAGDDAADARWVDAAGFAAMDAAGELVPGLREALAGWDVLPR